MKDLVIKEMQEAAEKEMEARDDIQRDWKLKNTFQVDLGAIEAEVADRMSTTTPIEDTRCESDKPIGTRDPDKFLKEQQDKMWREW